MASRKGTRTITRRVFVTRHTRSRHTWTPVRLLKWFIFGAPQVATAVYGYQVGGGGMNGISVAADQISQNFSGYSFMNNQWYLKNLLRGYGPLAAAWVFGKAASRVLR